jgi:hypothetical protein
LQENADGDSQGDACDPCPIDNPNDSDDDDICNSVDSCINDDENDADGDGYCANSGFIAPRIGDNDNCPEDANASQADGDGDGPGDACDVCTNVSNQRTMTGRVRVGLLDISEATTPDNDDRMLISGELTLPAATSFMAAVDPVHDPVRLAMDAQGGVRKVDITLPNAVYGGAGFPGWTLTAGGTKWTFRNRSATGAAGISSVVLKDRSDLATDLVRFKIRGSKGNYPLEATDMPMTLRLRMGAGIADCGEKPFTPEQCAFDEDDHSLHCEN